MPNGSLIPTQVTLQILGFASESADSCTDVRLKLRAAIELRDNLDRIFNVQQAFPAILKVLVPAFIKVLEGPPVFQSTSAEHVRISTRQ